jgi:hypothetical protein
MCKATDALSGVDALEREAEEIGRQEGAAIKHADLGASGRFAFAVLVEHVESDEPVRDMVATDLGEAITRACTWARTWGKTAYVYQLLTIAEPSYHLTDLREKGNG